ncbi:hypothetical protein [Archangium violaceum]|nr:hypothetical protein [Archangium violaceum]
MKIKSILVFSSYLAMFLWSAPATAQEEPADAQQKEESGQKESELILGNFPLRAQGMVVPDVAGIRVGMPFKNAMHRLRKYNKNLLYQKMTFGAFSAGIKGKFVIGAVVAQDGDYELPSRKGCRNGEIWERFRKKPTRVCWDSVHENIHLFVGGLPGKEYIVGVYLNRSYIHHDDSKFISTKPISNAPSAAKLRDTLIMKYGYPTAYSESELGHYVGMGYSYDSMGELASLGGGMFSLEAFDSRPEMNCFPMMLSVASKLRGYDFRVGDECGLAVRVRINTQFDDSLSRESKVLAVSVFMLDNVKLQKSIQERLAAIEQGEGRKKIRRTERKTNF